MLICISKINKKNDNDIHYYRYKASKKYCCLAIWMELLEPRYILNKESFLRAWKIFADCELDIVVGNTFQYEVLADYLTFFNSTKFEVFLEKIYIDYKFIVLRK